jgi:hypothetical protein
MTSATPQRGATICETVDGSSAPVALSPKLRWYVAMAASRFWSNASLKGDDGGGGGR